jgi:hypothetical protein
MRLSPFTLRETQDFLTSQSIKLNKKHVLELYMALGGIPHYLSLLPAGRSAAQCIDYLCFQRDGALINEFDRLFKSLFQEAEIYRDLILIIAKHRFGISQTQLLQESKQSKGGRFIKRLQDLEQAGFIISFVPHGHQEKGITYKIIDEYILFYVYWIEKSLRSIQKIEQAHGYWLSQVRSASYKTWSGYAFEAVCFKHLSQIRKALHIDLGSQAGSWRYAPRMRDEKKGAQIDLLFDRPDNAITICEIKHSDKPFVIDKEYASVLQRKMEIYQKQTRTTKQLFLTMITSGGLKESKYSTLVSASADLEDLFD